MCLENILHATFSQGVDSSVVTARARLRRESKTHHVSPYEALVALFGKLGPLGLGETAGSAMPFAGTDGADFDRKSLAPLEAFTEEQITPPVATSQVSETGYPPAFDPEVMRWVPLVVPLLGGCMVLLTGLMWSVVG